MRQLFRGFASSPGFFALVVLTLAVGIGANTAIFSVVRGVLLRPLPYGQPEELASISNSTHAYGGGGPLSVLEYVDVQTQTSTAATMTAYAGGNGTVTGDGPPERMLVAWVTPEFFRVLGVSPQVGRWFAAGEDRPGQDRVAVITHDLWQRRFGGVPEAIGKSLTIDREAYRVIGILPASFTFEQPFEAFLPLGFTPEQREPGTRDQHWLRVIARVQPGADVDDLDNELEVIGARLRAAHPAIYPESSGWRPHARPLLDTMIGDVRPSLWLLAAAAGLVLVIVCSNVASLLMARASTRQRELSVRAALGATRVRLLRQLMTESLILSVAGGVLGILLAGWATDLLISLAPEGLPRIDQVRLDGAVVVYCVGATILTGLVFGMIPAWGASRVDLQGALHSASRSVSAGRRPRRVRHALVVAETALALVLITAAALVTRSFTRVTAVDPGFRSDDLLTLRVTVSSPGEGERFIYNDEGQLKSADELARVQTWFGEAEQRLAALPGVSHVAVASMLPLADGLADRLLDIEGQPTPAGSQRPGAQYRVVSPGYFAALGIPVRRGRGIEPSDATATMPVTVVSDSFARETWPGADPLGHRIRTSSPPGPWLTVVGVVGDVHHAGLDDPAEPTIYVPIAQTPGFKTMAIVVRSTQPMEGLATAVRAALARFDRTQPIYDVRSMAERVAQTVASRRFVLVLFELFAGLALALAALGLYGVLAHAVTQRRREIGVRIALGASPSNVWRLIAREGAILVGTGIALGIAGGLAGTQLLQHLLYDVSPTDPLALVAAILLLASVSAIAIWVPVRRALRVDPMIVLRDE